MYILRNNAILMALWEVLGDKEQTVSMSSWAFFLSLVVKTPKITWTLTPVCFLATHGQRNLEVSIGWSVDTT